MVSRVISVYNGDLDKLMKDLIVYEIVIKGWKEKNPDYSIDLIIDVDEGEFYTLSVKCKKV
tara:strand:+ start:269 stop:451 length:183 start_codon:yes stop_codon:yes gene_type:complete